MSNNPYDALVIGNGGGGNNGNPQRSVGQSMNNDVNRTSRTSFGGDGSVTHEQLGTVRGTTADMPTGSDVFTAARTKQGREISGDQITEDSVVTLRNGMQAELGSFLRAGLVEKTSDGKYREGRGEQKQEQTEQHPDLQGVGFDQKTEDDFGQLLQSTTPDVHITAIREFAETGDLSEQLWGRIASEANTEPFVIQQQFYKAQAAFEKQANATVAAMGVDPEDVWEYAHEHAPKDLKKAMIDHATKRNPKVYKQFARNYVRDLEKTNPDALLEADLGEGIDHVRKDAKGKIVIQDNHGRTFGWSEAVRAGIVKVGRG